jgi:hypothetical protein
LLFVCVALTPCAGTGRRNNLKCNFVKKLMFVEDALALARGHAEQLAAFTCKVQNTPNQGTRYNLPDIFGTALNKSATRP